MTDTGCGDEEKRDGRPPADREDGHFQPGTFNDWVGLAVEEAGDGRAVLTVEYESFKQNPSGVLHGGVTATLVDVAAGIAINSIRGAEGALPTTNLDVNYLRPVTDDARATAEVVRVGDSNGVARVDVESTAPDGTTKTVAVGTVTYQVP